MYMDGESGQAFYTNDTTGETTWKKPETVPGKCGGGGGGGGDGGWKYSL